MFPIRGTYAMHFIRLHSIILIIIIVTSLGVRDNRRDTDLFTTRNYTLQFTDTHRLVSSVYYSLH
jgi:hypothetical protein